MVPITRKFATEAIGGAGKVVIKLDPAGVYHGIYLKCLSAVPAGLTDAQIIADVGTIIVKVNGEQKIEVLPAEALMLYRYYNQVALANPGIIPIDLTRPIYRLFERLGLAWGMADVTSLTVEIDILGVAALASIVPYAEIETPIQPRIMGRHICVRRVADAHATISVQNLHNRLTYGQPGIALLAAHVGLGAAPGVIDYVGVKASARNGQDLIIFDNLTLIEHNMMLHRAKRTANASWFHLDFNAVNDITGFLPTYDFTGLRADINWTTAPTSYVILQEEVRGLNQPVK